MRARSKKTEKLYVERRQIVERLLRERPRCEACEVFGAYDGKSRIIVRASVDIHELVSRGRGGSIVDEKNLLAVCRFPCHSRITTPPPANLVITGGVSEAEFLGLALPSWTTDQMYLEAAERRQRIASGMEVGPPSWV